MGSLHQRDFIQVERELSSLGEYLAFYSKKLCVHNFWSIWAFL